MHFDTWKAVSVLLAAFVTVACRRDTCRVCLGLGTSSGLPLDEVGTQLGREPLFALLRRFVPPLGYVTIHIERIHEDRDTSPRFSPYATGQCEARTRGV